MNQRPSNVRVFLFTILGLIIGGILGEALGALLGVIGEWANMGYDNSIRQVFIAAFEPSIGYNNPEGVAIDLYLIKFKFGFGFRFSFVSILGLFVAYHIEKWSRAR